MLTSILKVRRKTEVMLCQTSANMIIPDMIFWTGSVCHMTPWDKIYCIYYNENTRQVLLGKGLQQTTTALEIFDFIHILFIVLPTKLSKFGQNCYKFGRLWDPV